MIKGFLHKVTLFFTIGILLILLGLPYCIWLINGNSAEDGILGIFMMLGIIPVVIVLIIDRFLIRKYAVKKVNKVQFIVLGSLILLFLINWARLQLQLL